MILITYYTSHLHELTAFHSSVFRSLRKTTHVNRDKFPTFSNRFHHHFLHSFNSNYCYYQQLVLSNPTGKSSREICHGKIIEL